MRQVLAQLLGMVKGTIELTFVAPVREGRPRPSTWPRGLPAIGAASLVLYCLLALTAVFAVPLRRAGHLVLSGSSTTSLPESVIWLLLCGVIVSFALVHTAALHTSWVLRVALFVLGGVVLIFFVVPALATVPWAWMPPVGLYGALLVFTVIRARAHFAWWEFLVVTTIVAATLLSPGLISGMGNGYLVAAVEGMFSSLSFLAFPALLVAGAAPAQIVVTGAEALARRPVSRPIFWVLAALAAGWLVYTVVAAVRDGADELNPEALIASAIGLLLLAIAFALWLRRGRENTPDQPSTYADAWVPWLYPLAAVIIGIAVVILPVSIVMIMARYAGLNGVANVLELIWNTLLDNNLGVLWRAALGVVLLVIAWRISKRGRTAEATLLSALSLSVILDALGLIPALAFLHERNTLLTGLIAAGVALLIGVWLALRHALDQERASWLLTVVLLAVLYPFRNTLDDPAGAVLVFSAQLLVLFGLTWRLLSDAEWLEGDTHLLPRTTRVLLFIANTLFAATSIAFIALARATGTSADSTIWVNAGDWMLGEPLYTTGLVAALWLALRPRQIKAPGTEVPDALSIDCYVD